MAGKSRTAGDSTPRPLRNIKLLQRVVKLLEAVRDSGDQRDSAGNRCLHFDQYVLLVMLYLFNPAIESMRQLQLLSDSGEFEKKLGIRRFSLGSFSESCRAFDPQQLQQVIDELAPQVREIPRPRQLSGLAGMIELVDGTLLHTLCSVTAAMWLPAAGKSSRGTHAYKLHLNFDVDRQYPASFELTSATNSGDSDERTSLGKRLKADTTYVMDRGYLQYRLFNQIHDRHSSYVCRVRDNLVPQRVVEDRGLSVDDRQAAVLSDQVVKLGHPTGRHGKVEHPIRLICVKTTPHEKRGRSRGGTTGPASDGVLRIVTNLMDTPAHVIAFLYQYRWSVEIFIRFFKQSLGCRHLLSTKPQGIQIQVYAAILACMLLNIATGRRPRRSDLMFMQFYLSGFLSEASFQKQLNRPDNTGVKLRARDQAYRKMGF